MSTICAIIPTYNRSAMLRECVDSILVQTRPPDKIIIVDDGSTDDTAAVAQSYGNAITLLTKENGGKASALNYALATCDDDYIWICDDDDIAASNGLECLTKILDGDAETDFVCGTYKMFYDEEGGRVFIDPPPKARADETDIKILFLEGMIACQFAMLVRRSLYQKTGPFDETMIRSQDYEMGIRLSRSGKALRIPDTIFFQRQHAGVRGSTKDSFQADSMAQKWLAYDQKIFIRIWDEIPLADFTPSFARSWQGTLVTRATLIERGSIFACRALWDEATSDLKQAAAISDTDVTKAEAQIIETLMNFEAAWDSVLNKDKWIKSLRDIYKINRYGRQIMIIACRPLVWYARKDFQKGQFWHLLKIISLMRKILGLRGLGLRIILSLYG